MKRFQIHGTSTAVSLSCLNLTSIYLTVFHSLVLFTLIHFLFNLAGFLLIALVVPLPLYRPKHNCQSALFDDFVIPIACFLVLLRVGTLSFNQLFGKHMVDTICCQYFPLRNHEIQFGYELH